MPTGKEGRGLVPGGHQKTLRMIATGLARRPAYLLLFGLGVVGGGVSGSVGVMGGGYLQVFAIGSFFIFLLVSAMTVGKVEESFKPAGGPIPDFEANKEFLAGPNAARLSGAWELTWKWGAGDDVDQVTLVVSGATVFGSSYDDEHSRSYWFLGRIDDDGDLPALFWGRDGCGPVGCAFLQRDGRSKFAGTWKGVDKDDEDGHCDVVLERKA